MTITQKRSIVPLTGLFLLLLTIGGCQREVNIDLDKGFSSQIQQIVPQSILDSLRSKGMVINEGLVPPQLEGIYFNDPNILVAGYGPTDSKPGSVFASYYYKFYAQDVKGNITYDRSTASKSDVGKGRGAFIAGNGNKFTIFSEQSSVTQNISNKSLTVISGEITSSGIKDWQNAFVLVDKTGDTDNILVDIGRSRVFKDGDGLAVKGIYFPQSIQPQPKTESARVSASFSDSQVITTAQ